MIFPERLQLGDTVGLVAPSFPIKEEELTDCVPTVPGADQAVEDRELAELLERFLSALPRRDRDIFLRRYWFVEPLADVARRYGMKENTVKASLFRSRRKLKDYLKQEGIIV